MQWNKLFKESMETLNFFKYTIIVATIMSVNTYVYSYDINSTFATFFVFALGLAGITLFLSDYQ